MKFITICGREFRFVQNDIDHAHYRWTSAHLWPCRVEQVLRNVGENDESYAERIFARLHEQPEFYSLIGGVILPAELPESEWTPMIARETGAFLHEIADLDSRRAFMRQAVDAVINFCRLRPDCLSEATTTRRERTAAKPDIGDRLQRGDL